MCCLQDHAATNSPSNPISTSFVVCLLQALADVVGFEIKRDEVTSLKRLLDHDIAAHLARITELSDQASR